MDSFDFTHAGQTFRATIEPDETSGPPWEDCDGHGPVTGWQSRSKLPGELVLCGDGAGRLGTDREHRFYDFAEACRIARRDGWGFLPGPLKTEQTDSGLWRASCKGSGIYRGFDVVCTASDINVAINRVFSAFRATFPSPRAYHAAAARADFERLRSWANDGWRYVGVVVQPLCPHCGEEHGESASLWGLESDCEESIREAAEELAGDLGAANA